MSIHLPKVNLFKEKILSLILLGSGFVGIILGTRFSIVDDAYISFRYAYQLAHQGILVFNPGERVEGITNLLWTVLLTVLSALTRLPIEQVALLSSIALLFAACLRLWQLGPLLKTTYLAGALAAILLLTSSDFLSASTNGLEVALFTCLFVEIIYHYTRDRLKRATFFAGLLFLTRPESLFVGLLLIGFIVAKFRSLRKAVPGASILAAFVIVTTCYRYFTYGALLPNSVLAKSFPLTLLPGLAIPIFNYILGFIKANLYFVILALGGSFSLLQTRFKMNKQTEVLLFCLLCLLFSVVVVARNGGDWMGNHRLLAQYGVLYAVILIILVSNHSLSLLFAFAFVLMPFMQTTNLFVNFKPVFPPQYNPNTNLYTQAVSRLAPVVQPTDSISAEAIGYIAYHLIDNPFIDPFGLTEAVIAKNGDPRIPYGKSDFQYLTTTLQPAVMVWHYPGHLRGIAPEVLAKYESYCLGSCKDWSGYLVMIRQDRAKDIAPAFSDWQKIDINLDWPR